MNVDRRRFIAWLSTGGIAVLLGPKVFAQEKEEAAAVATEAIAKAETLSGLTFTPEERDLMQKTVGEHLASFQKLREVPLGNAVSPALVFSPLLPGETVPTEVKKPRYGRLTRLGAPSDPAELAFLPVARLGDLIRRKAITSADLTELYLDRLKQYDPKLECVITLTADRAREEAKEADREVRRGRIRGPLHGIPYGLKDLFAARGARTTWGAKPFENQVLDEDATVVTRLREAGAVLLAKLSVGALAWGDVWFGGTTKNPWKLDQGSSGSSAGPASATVAGCVGFAIGTETLGSIMSPSARCGATGLRPTFGRVSRAGGMALAWSMDKAGPICRAVEDCALVLDAIRGADGKDPAALDAPFNWDAGADPRALRVGYDKAAFEEKSDDAEFNQTGLRTLREMGIDPKPITLPDLPVSDMLFILEAEAAAAFDDLTRTNRDELLVRQVEDAWPNVFRAARFIPAVEYIQANRIRTLLMQRFGAMMADVDVYVHPTFGGNTLLATNLTGNPSLVLPNGFREDGTPVSFCFTGRLFGEAELCLLAKAYQDRTGYHLKHPML